ncbi:MAG: MBL fold metallo-hydrolase [Lachnospiraceae bacterium]|nr:MBL fold metallo-hydrolase [Lachnospiraceae bacterium]
MELFSIASGSSGNCICVGNDTDHVLIDVGISGKKVEAGMNEMGYTTPDMSAILITHEHSDHVSGLGVISRKYSLPVYATQGTIDAIFDMPGLGKLDKDLFHVIKPDVPFLLGSLKIKPIRISHDAAEPVAYILSDGKKKIGVITDLGMYDEYIVENISGLSALLLEANHDVRMLEVGRYPYPLKRRILGNKGHLSNELSGQLLGRVLHDNMTHVLLGHLSHENNYPRLAYETVSSEVTLGDNPYKGSDFPIDIAGRDRVSERIVC